MLIKITAVLLTLLILLSAGVNVHAQDIEETAQEETEENLPEDLPAAGEETVIEETGETIKPEETEVTEETEKTEVTEETEETGEPEATEEPEAADETEAPEETEEIPASEHQPVQGQETMAETMDEQPVIIAASVTTKVEITINPNASDEEELISTGGIEIINHSQYPIEAVVTGITDSPDNVFVSFTDNTVQNTSQVIDWKNLGTDNTKKYIAFSVGGRDIYGSDTLLYITDMDKEESGDNKRTIPLMAKTGYAWDSAAEINYTFEFLLEIKDYKISASESLLDFGSVVGTPYEPPAEVLVTLTNTGTGKITLTQPVSDNYVISTLPGLELEAGQWAEFTIRPNGALPAGIYNERIEVTGNYGARTVIFAEFMVENPVYQLSANDTSIVFGMLPVGNEMPPAKPFRLTNTGNVPVEVEITGADDWFTIDGQTQTQLLEPDGVAHFEVRPNADLLSGRYTGTIRYRWSNGESSVPVSFIIADAGFIINTTANDAFALYADFPAGSGVLWGDSIINEIDTERNQYMHVYSSPGRKNVYLWGGVDNIKIYRDSIEIIFMRDNMVMQFMESSWVTFGSMLLNKKIDVWLIGGGAHGNWSDVGVSGANKGGWGGASGHVINQFGIDVSAFYPNGNNLIIGKGAEAPLDIGNHVQGGTTSFLDIHAHGGYMQDEGGVSGGNGGDPEYGMAGDGQNASENPDARPFRTGTEYYGGGGGGGRAESVYTYTGKGGAGAGGNGGDGGSLSSFGRVGYNNSGSGGGGGGAASRTAAYMRGGSGGSGRVHIRFNNG